VDGRLVLQHNQKAFDLFNADLAANLKKADAKLAGPGGAERAPRRRDRLRAPAALDRDLLARSHEFSWAPRDLADAARSRGVCLAAASARTFPTARQLLCQTACCGSPVMPVESRSATSCSRAHRRRVGGGAAAHRRRRRLKPAPLLARSIRRTYADADGVALLRELLGGPAVLRGASAFVSALLGGRP
jgi:hypothetical protein